MHVSIRTSLALCAASLVVLLASTGAQAAPITVNLRVEGSSKTLYEGPVTTEGETFQTPAGEALHEAPHPCNYAENGHSENEKHEVFTNGGTPTATPTSALHHAALSTGLEFNAEWSTSYGDFLVTQVGPDINEDKEPFASWGYAVNDTTAPVGGCQIALAPGNEVLWAYNYFNLKHLLSLTGPTSANEGSPITVHVVDGQTGAPIAGATIGEDVAGVTTTLSGSPTTNAEGNATVALAHTGTVELKATQPESVRSNAIGVCVHNGNDGTCGTQPLLYACAASAPVSSTPAPSCGGPPVIAPPPAADAAVAGGVKAGHVYPRHKGPRILSGLVKVPAGGTLREVRISLQRRVGKRCFAFNGTTETFVRDRCGATRFFSVGGSESFSYLLPSSLPKGRYVYDIEAIDDAGVATKLVPGVSHVVFYVK
jgi:hypothetical protein